MRRNYRLRGKGKGSKKLRIGFKRGVLKGMDDEDESASSSHETTKQKQK
jgi:hypothetical protein